MKLRTKIEISFVTLLLILITISNVSSVTRTISSGQDTIHYSESFLTVGDEYPIAGDGFNTSNFTYWKLITINHSYVDGNLTNFPILVSNTSSGFSNAQSDGDDFTFSNVANTTQYNHEIEDFNSTTNTLIAWVNITDLRDNINTQIILHYGNTTCGSQENVNGTWDGNFIGVWHMNDYNATHILDSSGNGWFLNETGSPTQTTGMIGYAQAFDGSSNFFMREGDDYPDTSNNWCLNQTITAWINVTTIDVIDRAYYSRHYIFGDGYISHDNGNAMKYYWRNETTDVDESSATADPTAEDVWYSLTQGRDNSTHIVSWYLNNSLIEVDTDAKNVVGGSMGGSHNDITIGCAEATGAPTERWNGTIDEVRVSNINRSASWVKTEYNTSFYPNQFLTVGAQFPPAAGSVPIFSNPNPSNGSTNIPITTNYWNITIQDPDGDDFNLTITTAPNVGYNSSNYTQNGTDHRITLSGLAYSTTYTIWANVTNDSQGHTNKSINTFTTEAALPILSNEQPANKSFEIWLYPWLNITVNDSLGLTFNITWRSNATGSWVTFATNTTCTNGTYRQRFTLANTSFTKYFWTVRVNNSATQWTNESYEFTTANYTWGNWSTWWQFNYSASSPPTNLTAATYSKTAINLSWTNPTEAWDSVVVIVNASGWGHYPRTPSNGTEIYNGTNVTYNHTGLANGMYYYYGAWAWNDTNANYSSLNTTSYNKTFSPPTISALTPLNGSFYADRQPACRVWANDSDGNPLTVNFWNSSDGTNYHYRQTNGSVTANSTVYWRYTQASLYSTNYWWKVFVNDAETNTTEVFNFTTMANIAPNVTGEIPVNASTQQQVSPPLNVTVNDNNADSLDVYWISNSSGAWVQFGDNKTIDTASGPVIIYWTNANFSALSTTYYWSINCSDGTTWTNETYNFSTGAMSVSLPFPANLSTGNNRPPTNISVQVNGTAVDVYFYWRNMTTVTNVTQLVQNWTGNSNRYNFSTLWSNGWVWGDTNYTWFVNVTDGSIWINRTYTYRTKGSRYDVTNSDDVIITDVVRVWDNRAGAATYDGIYDVDYSGDIIISDVVDVWDNRS